MDRYQFKSPCGIFFLFQYDFNIRIWKTFFIRLRVCSWISLTHSIGQCFMTLFYQGSYMTRSFLVITNLSKSNSLFMILRTYTVVEINSRAESFLPIISIYTDTYFTILAYPSLGYQDHAGLFCLV